MKNTVSLLKEIVDELSAKLIGKRINKMVLINRHAFLLTISELKEEKLLINLLNQNPYIALISTEVDIPGFSSNFVSQMIGKNAKPLINNIELINEDKIIRIETLSTDQYYHRNKHYLYIELIAAHPNMILTDENNKIIVPYNSYSLTSIRPMMKDLTYTLPNKEKNSEDSKTSILDFKKYVEKDFQNVLKDRHHEIFGNYIKKNNRRIKTLIKKNELIKETEQKANENLAYKEIGQSLLMYSEENDYNLVEKDLGITLDRSISITKNAEKYFAKYKKAKRTLENIDRLYKNVDDEIFHLNYLNEQIETLSEQEAEKLIEKECKKKNINIDEEIRAYEPYKINYLGTTYYFGKNYVQNDYLSFHMFSAKSQVTWLHIKNASSAHLIINKSTPTKEELEIAMSLLLLASKETSAEIMVASRKNIYRGNEIGKAEVLSYETYKINAINEKAKELYSKAKK